MQDIHFYNLHLPEEVRLLHIPPQYIRLWNDQVIIYDFRVHDLILRRISFYTDWFEISFFLKEDGTIETLPGEIPIGFLCDITSPLFSYGTEVYNVDLAFDIFITPDGKRMKIVDQSDFQKFIDSDSISPYEAEKARLTLKALEKRFSSQNINQYISEIFPDYRKHIHFDIQSLSRSQDNLLLSEVPNLGYSVRDRQFGKKIP